MRVRDLQHGDAFRFTNTEQLKTRRWLVLHDERMCVAWDPFVPSDVRTDMSYLWLPFPASLLEVSVTLVARWDGYLRDVSDLPDVDRTHWPADCDRCGEPAVQLFNGMSCSARCCYERR